MEDKIKQIKSSMEYVRLGNSGLKVSRFCYGTMAPCVKSGVEAQQLLDEMVKLSFDCGINCYDTSELYGYGNGEKMLGISLKALGVPRSDYLVFNKIFFGKFEENTNQINNLGTSRKRLVEGLERSLNNLGLDYVDVIFCNRYDAETPTLEVCQAMKDIIASGKAFYWATSEWPSARIMEAIHLCDKIGAPRPIAEQCCYNMLRREYIEDKYTVFFDDYGYGSTTWSPLESGILTGKYNNGVPEGSRLEGGSENQSLNSYWKNILKRYFPEEGDTANNTAMKLTKLTDIGAKIGLSLPQLALAWVIMSKDVSTCILGSSRPSQMLDNLDAYLLKDKLTAEVLEEIENVLANRPYLGFNYRSQIPVSRRR